MEIISNSENTSKLLREKKRKNILEFAGKWAGDKKELDEIEKMIYNDRKKAKTRDDTFEQR